MGKISPPSIKYIIKVKFETEGIVEKPDIIGAVFGQTEGLLGEDLELRELQKKGKIGRIEVTLDNSGSKTTGMIEIPTSIDKAETTIIAAAVETIDRIGPANAKFEIEDLSDVRTSKREYILERAKKLMEKMNQSSPESREMEQQVMDHAKTAKIQEYGKELLPAGPDIESSSEIIVVEGRADVMTLLRAGIKNAIAMNGTSLPKTIVELGKEKKITLFVDGDRGGVLNAKDATSNAEIAFIARAPDGKEVEELTEKEINLCLRARTAVDEFKKKYFDRNGDRDGRPSERSYRENKYERQEKEETQELTEEDKKKLGARFEEIKGTKSAIIIAKENGELKEDHVSSNSLLKNLHGMERRNRKIFGLLIDDVATNSIIRAAEDLGCKVMIANNFASTSDRIEFLSL
jgi:DNA primase